ncbi:MAG: hypothetical protein IPJ02_04185 [Chitinophagaceae bacterium]|nr:hypothetical protein [Chitinophagaceae bacterium]
MQHNQALFESLFKRNFSDPGNKNFLEGITAAHPYFSPAQFYLLQRTDEGTAAFEEQAGKTNIFFNNPLWLNFQLQQTEPETLKEATVIAGSAPEIQEAENIVEPEPVKVDLPVIENITETKTEPEPEFEPEPVMTELPVMENITKTEPEPEFEPEPVMTELPVMENITKTEPEPEFEPEPLKIELKLPEEKNITDDLPLFEPMHMVDYFASQGIKLGEEVQAGDKLGKQLKSFTEWLKTMKKVHTVATAEETIKTDLTVEALAEMSNTENEVITEAMAEVFARQGKTGRAMEVYQKLSLLNPAKSAYFAAKIENLKGA